jgi:hypothetical protein
VRHRLLVGVTLALTATLTAGCGASVSAGPFAGVWRVHTYYLVIKANGSGSAKWPTHVFCRHGVPSPCDKISSSGEITDGGHADLRITSVHDDTALGQVTDSTVQSTLPDGPVALLVDLVNNVLYMTVSRPTTASPYGTTPLCGPTASEKSDREGSAAKFNCGA